MFDPVEGCHLGLKELADEDRSSWSPAARADRVRDLAVLAERTQAELVRAVGDWDTGKDWALDGQLSAPAWLAWQTPMVKTHGGRVVADAEFLARHPDIAHLLAGGDIAVPHVTAMARAEHHHEPEFAICKDSLLESARVLNPTDFAAVCRNWATLVDDRAPRDHAQRGFRIRELMDGWGVPDGLLDPETVALWRAAMKDLHPPDPPDLPEGPRTANQRGADTLADLLNRHLRGHRGEAPSTTVDLVVDSDTLTRHRFAEFLLPADRLPADPNWETSQIDGRPLGLRDAERLLCDSPIGAVIVDRTGEILDVGRQNREYTRAQRRGMARRDGPCCPWPGCDRPYQWLDAHHLDFWHTHHGQTNLDRGVLVCRRHHILIHNGGWTLERDRDTGTYTATSPDGRTFTNNPLTKHQPDRTTNARAPALC
jgi:hypothetical protein